MEHLLQYAWMHKIFPLETLKTTDGVPIEIINSGLKNHNAGPDFFNAQIKIGDILWSGNIEVHSTSSDWYKHGHDKDEAYNSIILHVTGNPDCSIFRSNGESIPQFHLKCPQHVQSHYYELCKTDYFPRCYNVISSLSFIHIHSWLTALQIERLEQKTNAIQKRVELCEGSWENAFFITFARNLGFGLNGDTFERWAYGVPLHAINKHRDNLEQIEALFFGTAGLLETPEGDDYYMKLQKEYLYLQHKFNLPKPIDTYLWRKLRIRPYNFSHVRIAQMAALYHRKDSLFSKFIEISSPVDLYKLLDVSTSNYWDSHFSFTHSSPTIKKKWGTNAINLIIINTLIPFLYAYGKHRGNEAFCERALEFLSQIKHESNTIIRQWEKIGLSIKTAGDSQALIQLQKEYCDKKKCLYCRFGYEFLCKREN